LHPFEKEGRGGKGGERFPSLFHEVGCRGKKEKKGDAIKGGAPGRVRLLFSLKGWRGGEKSETVPGKKGKKEEKKKGKGGNNCIANAREKGGNRGELRKGGMRKKEENLLLSSPGEKGRKRTEGKKGGRWPFRTSLQRGRKENQKGNS